MLRGKRSTFSTRSTIGDCPAVYPLPSTETGKQVPDKKIKPAPKNVPTYPSHWTIT